MDAVMQERIEETVMDILRNSDMEKMTESKVRKQAAEKLGIDLSEPSRKKFVRQVVESFLQEQQLALAAPQQQNDAAEVAGGGDGEDEDGEEEEEESNTNRSDGKEYDDEGNLIICRIKKMDGSSTPSNEELTKPLWKYVTKYERLSEGGGNLSWACNFCGQNKKSSYTRIRAHLLKISGQGISGCSKVTSKDISQMQKLEEDAKERAKMKAPKKVPLPPSSNFPNMEVPHASLDNMLQGERKRKKTGSESSNSVEKTFNIEAREMLDANIARMFYSAGLPFHLARNPYYMSSYAYAAKNSLSGYVPPSYNKLRTTLLVKERQNVERLLEPIKGTWKQKGVSIVTDGWSDSQRRPLINFMAVTEGGPIFIKAIDASGEIKDKYFIFELLKEVIEEVGPNNVVQVITDNAKNCEGAGALVHQVYPHIFWTPCVVHTLNLALQNICAAKKLDNNIITYGECLWITKVYEDCQFIKNFIMSHSMRLTMFNEFVPLNLLAVASTRFASTLIMMKRFKLIKGSLQSLVNSEQWANYRKDGVGNARTVKEKVLDDMWWGKIDYIISFTAPIYDMIRFCDTDKGCLHLIYDMWDCMIEKVKIAIYKEEKKSLKDKSTFYNVVYDILIDRWTKNNTPLHCMAHSLNPRYYSDQWLNEEENRVPPHKDLEVSQERMKCVRKYFPNVEDRAKANIEYAAFSTRSQAFSDIDSIHDRYTMDSKSWWVVYGTSAPLLQNLALKLLEQPSSSSCSERNWSTYSFIHSLKRNKMAPKRVEDLVFIHSNLRLLSRRTQQYVKGECRMWDICGDGFDSLGDIGELEIAQLSLDEPELERVVFLDDEDDHAIVIYEEESSAIELD